MLSPLICVVIALQSLSWRLFENHAETGEIKLLFEVGTPLQWSMVWGFYILVFYGLTQAGRHLKTPLYQMRASLIFQVLATALFITLLPYGMWLSEILLESIYDRLGYSLDFIWSWSVMLPFFIVMVLILGRPTGKGRQHLRYPMRLFLIILLPYFLGSLILDEGLWKLVLGVWQNESSTFTLIASSEYTFPITCILIVLLYLILPFFSGLVLITKPIEAGPLRELLTLQSRSVDVTYHRLCVWDAGPGQVNAAVMGALPFNRILLITDAMRDRFDEDEIRHVFWHELGHIVQKHLLIYLLYFLAIPGLMVLLFDSLDLPLEQWMESTITIGVWALGFIFLSRNLEKQADLYAFKREESEGAYCSTLRKLGSITGLSKFRSLTHGSLDDRIHFLQRSKTQPEVEDHLQRKITYAKVILLVLFFLEWGYWISRYWIS